MADESPPPTPSPEGDGRTPSDLERAIEDKLDEMWATAQRLAAGNMDMPSWVRTRMLTSSRFAQVNRVVAPVPVSSPGGPQVTLADTRLVLARNLASARGDRTAIAAAGQQLADDLDALTAQSPTPDAASLLELVHTWLNRVPVAGLYDDRVVAIASVVARLVADEPSSLGAAAAVLGQLPRGEPAVERARWFAHKRVLDAAFARVDGEVLADPEVQAAAATVAAHLATATSIVRRHVGTPTEAAVDLVRLCNLVAAAYEPNPLGRELEQDLQEMLDVLPVPDALIVWWCLRSGRWLIDRSPARVAPLDAVTVVVAAAARGASEAGAELGRLLEQVTYVEVDEEDRLVIGAAAVEMTRRATTTIADALGSEVALSALPHIARALNEMGERSRAQQALAEQLALLPGWRALASRSTPRAAEVMSLLRGIRPDGPPRLSSSAEEEGFDPQLFVDALLAVLESLTDRPVPGTTAPDDVARWLARITWRLRSRGSGEPENFDRAMDLRFGIHAQPAAPAELWRGTDLDEAEILGPDAEPWLNDVRVLAAEPEPIATLVRIISADMADAHPPTAPES